MSSEPVTRERLWHYDAEAPMSFDMVKLQRRRQQAMRHGLQHFQWLTAKVLPLLKTATIDTTLLVGIGIVEFALHVMDERERDLRIFRMSDCDWWAGWDLEQSKTDFAKYHDYYNGKAAEAAGVIQGAREVTREEMDHLFYTHDVLDYAEHEKCTFRQHLAEMIEAEAQFPCFFASTGQ